MPDTPYRLSRRKHLSSICSAAKHTQDASFWLWHAHTALTTAIVYRMHNFSFVGVGDDLAHSIYYCFGVNILHNSADS